MCTGFRNIKKGVIKMRLFKTIVLILIMLAVCVVYDFLKFPETYITTWKHQLQQDIESGNEKAIEYYTIKYVSNERVLFD